MQQENDFIKKFVKLDIPSEQSTCLDVQISTNGCVAQLFKNNKITIFNQNTNKDFTIQSDKIVYSSVFSHPDSFNSHLLYLFGQSIQVIDLEKQQIANQITTEFTYCGDSNIWNELCVANEKTLLFWDMRQQLAFNCILAHSMCITSCSYNETGKLITTTGLDNVQHIINIKCARVFDSYGTDSLVTICGSKKTHTSSSMFTKDSKHILVTTLDQPLGLWDWVECTQLASYPIKFQNRFFIKPILLYDDPMKILYPNDNNQIFVFDFLNPDEKPIIQDLNFGNCPVRFIQSNGIYAFVNNEVYRCEY